VGWGKITKFIATASFSLCVLTLLPGTQSKADSTPTCGSLVEVASVSMLSSPGGAVSIPAQIENRDVSLTVATGSQASLLSNEEADSLKLSRRGIGGVLFTLGGVTPKEFVIAHDVHIGHLSAAEWSFVLMPASALPAGVAGAVGADLLHSYDVDLDFGAARLRLVSPQHCEGRVVYWTKGPVAIVPMTLDAQFHMSVSVVVDDVATRATIDTGAQQSAISASLFSGTLRGRAIRSLSLEGVAIANPHLTIAPDAAYVPDAPQVVIGADLLRRFHAYFAYGEKRIYLTGADAH